MSAPRHRIGRLALAVVVVAATCLATNPAQPTAAVGGPRKLGAATYYDVMNAATEASALCPEATPTAIAAAMLAPVWIESSAGTGVPSPMAHSRWDNKPGLYYDAYGETYFWNPGIGIWQMDSAGLGRQWTAWQRVSTSVMAPVVANYIVTRYCAATGTELDRARAAWGWRPELGKFSTWHACNASEFTACDQVFTTLYDGSGTLQNLILDTSVNSLGGMQPSTCQNTTTGATITCFYMDFAQAQGTTSGYLNCSACPTPKPRDYLSYTAPSGEERRQFYRADGSISDIYAARAFDEDARNGLAWYIGIDTSISSSLDPIPPPSANIVLPSVL